MKKLIYKISEEEKNRILGLHRKQVIIERSQNKKLLSESEIKILLREQQENEVEVLLNSLSENDPPEKWQQIIDKVEDLGEDVVTFIKKMKNKQLGKKFGNFLKNNFNRVKFKQAGDKIVSFFNKLLYLLTKILLFLKLALSIHWLVAPFFLVFQLAFAL